MVTYVDLCPGLSGRRWSDCGDRSDLVERGDIDSGARI
jgi:hypothetical protein